MPSVDPGFDTTQSLAPTPAAEGSGVSARPRPDDDELRDDDRYELIAEHGRGGLGRVVRARDRYLERTVAVKELLRTNELAERLFLREAMITARLEHPGIVPVHEAGRWRNGDPYYVMKLVSGRTLKEVMAAARTLGERLALLPHLIAVADAVGYAHSEGVIHRDLKPANVLVGEFGETVVIDWGLARDLRAPEGALPELPSSPGEGGPVPTVTGKVIGTPQYMAPEQARGEAVGPGADVYALGSMLYELLAGRPPVAGDSAQALLDQLRAGPPPPLSRAASGIPADLGAIVEQAMAREPAHRYPTARELAADLKRFQTGQLVTAQHYGRWQLLRRWLVRHRTWVAMATMALVAGSAVAVGLLRQVFADRRHAEERRARAEVERARAEASEAELILSQARAEVSSDPTTALAWLKRYPVDDGHADEIRALIDEAESAGVAARAWPLADPVRGATLAANGAWVAHGTRDGFVEVRATTADAVRRLGDGTAAISAVTATPDATAVVAGDVDGRLTRIDVTDGHVTELARLDGPVLTVRATRSGAIVARTDAHVWRLAADGSRSEVLPGATRLERMAMAADDRTGEVGLAHGSDGKLRLWRAGVGPTVVATIAGMPARLAITNDGSRAVVATTTALHWLDVTHGTVRALLDLPAEVNRIVIDPTQTRAAVVTQAADVYLIDLATGTLEVERGHTDGVYTAAFDARGQRMVTASDDGTVRIWDLPTGDVRELRGHKDDVLAAAIADDGRTVLSVSIDQTMRVWRIEDRPTRVFGRLDDVRVVSSLGDDRVRVLSFGRGARVIDVDLTRGAAEVRLDDPRGLPGKGVLTSDGSAWWFHGPSTIARWQGGAVTELARPSMLQVVLGDGGRIVGVDLDGTVWASDGDQTRTIAHADPGTTLRGRADSSLVVLSDRDGFRLLDARTGQLRAQVDRATLGVSEVAVGSPLGGLDRMLVTDPQDRNDAALRLWDPETPAAVVALAKSRQAGGEPWLSPDGHWLVASIEGRALRVWDTRTGEVRATLRGHRDLTFQVAFSPDSARLATASYDRTVRVWELASGTSRVLSGHVGPVWTVTWLDRDRVVSGSADGTVRVWSVPRRGAPVVGELQRRLATLTAVTVDRDSHTPT